MGYLEWSRWKKDLYKEMMTMRTVRKSPWEDIIEDATEKEAALLLYRLKKTQYQQEIDRGGDIFVSRRLAEKQGTKKRIANEFGMTPEEIERHEIVAENSFKIAGVKTTIKGVV